MNGQPKIYLLDTNVFIQAHQRYYALDLCPGFWNCLVSHCQGSRILSIDRVRREILDGDALATWVASSAPTALFASTAEAPVIQVFAEMMAWVQGNSQFKNEAKAEFARVADGWLAAYAKIYGAVVVTQEEYRPDEKKKVPLPNVCREFDVEWCNTFAMLRGLEVRFHWHS